MGTGTSKLLLEHFLAWQREQGERRTLKEFADYIGISDKSLNHVFTGTREPTERQTQLFAVVFDDPRFYKVTNRKPEDPKLIYINRHWKNTPTDIQKKIAEEIQKYTTEKAPTDE
jgi:hypothetical protein